MDELIREPLNLVIILVAILVAIPLFSWLLTLVQATFRALLSIAAIGIIAALVLIGFFGVSPDRMTQQISHIPQAAQQLLTDGKAPWKSVSQAFSQW